MNESTSILEAASAGVKDMADGSLRITIEFSPVHAKEAYALFGARGTPLAITALKTGYAAAGGALQPPKEKLGALCVLAVQWCKDPQFWDFLNFANVSRTSDIVGNDQEAKELVCFLCGIDSRKELDSNERAAAYFDRAFRKPYMAYLKANQQRI